MLGRKRSGPDNDAEDGGAVVDVDIWQAPGVGEEEPED